MYVHITYIVCVFINICEYIWLHFLKKKHHNILNSLGITSLSILVASNESPPSLRRGLFLLHLSALWLRWGTWPHRNPLVQQETGHGMRWDGMIILWLSGIYKWQNQDCALYIQYYDWWNMGILWYGMGWESWSIYGKSSPNGRTIQVSEVLKFTQMGWDGCHDGMSWIYGF